MTVKQQLNSVVNYLNNYIALQGENILWSIYVLDRKDINLFCIKVKFGSKDIVVEEYRWKRGVEPEVYYRDKVYERVIQAIMVVGLVNCKKTLEANETK